MEHALKPDRFVHVLCSNTFFFFRSMNIKSTVSESHCNRVGAPHPPSSPVYLYSAVRCGSCSLFASYVWLSCLCSLSLHEIYSYVSVKVAETNSCTCCTSCSSDAGRLRLMRQWRTWPQSLFLPIPLRRRVA